MEYQKFRMEGGMEQKTIRMGKTNVTNPETSYKISTVKPYL